MAMATSAEGAAADTYSSGEIRADAQIRVTFRLEVD